MGKGATDKEIRIQRSVRVNTRGEWEQVKTGKGGVCRECGAKLNRYNKTHYCCIHGLKSTAHFKELGDLDE